jgi:MFS family permease
VSERTVEWRLETILLGSGVFGNIAMSTLSPALPKIEQAFGGAEADYLTKMLISATGLGVIMVSPFTGTLARRFGRRAVVVGAYAIFLVFGMLGMLLPTLPLIIATRFVAGAAGAVIVAMALILIGDFYLERPRERRIGASHAIGAVVLAALVPVAGFLADINWRLSFVIHLAALPMLLLALTSRDLADAARSAEAVSAGGDARSARFPPAVWLILLLALFAGGIGYSVQIFVPFHLRDIGAHSAGLAGVMLAVTLVTSMTTSFLYAEVRRFISVPVVFAIVFGGWALGLGVTAVTTTVMGTLIGMGITGLAGGLVGPNMFSAVSALTTDSARAHSIGVVKGIYYFGPFFGPTMLQLLSLQKHPETALLSLSATGATLAAICLVAGFISARGRRGALAPEPVEATEAQLDSAYEAELESDRGRSRSQAR